MRDFTLVSGNGEYIDRKIIGVCGRKFKNLLKTKYVIVYDDKILAMKNADGIVFDICTNNVYSEVMYPNLYFVFSTPKYYLRQYDKTFNIVVAHEYYKDEKIDDEYGFVTRGKVFSVYKNERDYLKTKLGI